MIYDNDDGDDDYEYYDNGITIGGHPWCNDTAFIRCVPIYYCVLLYTLYACAVHAV